MLKLRFPLVLPVITLVSFSALPGFGEDTRPQKFGYPIAPLVKESSLACYMKTATGQLLNLDVFCTAQEPVLGSGDVQSTVRWRTKDDVDLAVIDPSGEKVFYQKRKVTSGGELDVDANAGCGNQMARPVENVFWPRAGAPSGKYRVEVNLFKRCNSTRVPVPFTLTLLVKGTTKTFNGTVGDANRTVSFPFTVP